MRFLILNRICRARDGATGRLIAELASALRAAGHEAVTPRAITRGGILSRLLAFVSLGLQGCAVPADRILVMTDPPLLWLWIPLWRWLHPRRPIFYWCQDLYPDLLPLVGWPFGWRWLMPLKKFCLRSVSVVAIGDCMAARLRPYSESIITLPNWPEQDLSPLPLPPDDKLHLLYAGQMGAVHGGEAVMTAITACADLPCHFTLLLPPRALGRAKKVLAGQGNVTLLPRQSWQAARGIMAAAHVHIAALRPAAAGLSVPSKAATARGLGRPYIFMGPSESAAALGAAVVLNPDDVFALRDAIAAYPWPGPVAPPPPNTPGPLVAHLIGA